MRTLALLAFLIAQPAFADWPYDAPAPAAKAWPYNLKTSYCNCGPDCTCTPTCECSKKKASALDLLVTANAIGCGKGRSGNSASVATGFTADWPYPTQTVAPAAIYPLSQGLTAVTLATPDPLICPCCGMKMTPEQAATMKAKQAAATLATPVYAQPVYQTYTPPVTYYYSGGAYSSDGTCVGGNCGTSSGGRQGLFGGGGLFGRWR